MKFKRQRSQHVAMDLTPLIDVVFLLLIFFMVSTTFTRESHLQVELPQASGNPAPPAEVEQIDVVISADGQYLLNDKPLVNNRRETLERGIRELADADTSLPFIITADARTPHEFVVRAMDAAGRLGFAKLSITTEREAQSQ
ncbi:biopolymer transporter ExbD [Marinobacter sp. M3C]|uniref:ExbD/TolR family protein n=1 Tax=unclassified Marinobacter TaxID=83889 RepID=UPI00200D5E2E|nr:MULTISPECIES: biopolymer transporter ExbD [unclassified Marinobacter]MCL1477050.1 biopolymer transporter ExbD [Marinobacter sp.]MCL1482448.1 biopolymer transporter ExbD [Marinobacter sp.]MCL1486255.1 biopolymer transporter ExbD [Marinobacter sp.]MCL1488631.1 biopolymer transporter ExbD [Marinobacter sp.]UQG54282.1 biopolymer transporter ExbD [Marinobacter sp. M4C]